MFKIFIRAICALILVSTGLTGCMVEKKLNNPEGASTPTATKIVFVTQPGGGSAGAVWTIQPVVQIQSSTGDKITEGPDAWATITLSIESGNGTLGGTLTVPAVQGEAKFTGLKIDSAGYKSLKAVKSDTTSYKGSAGFTATSDAFGISSGPATKLTLNASAEINPSQCAEITVAQTDAEGNAVNATSAIPLVITGNSNGSIYSDSTCTAVLNSPSIPNGASAIKIYYKNLGQESLRLNVSHGTGVLTSAYQNLRVTKLTPSKYYMGGANSHACTLYTNKSFFCTGTNNYGQLGYPSGGTPKVVTLTGNISELALGETHTCALMDDGSVQCWGANYYGQLGNGTTTASVTPVTVNLGGPATQLLAGYLFSCALVTISSVPTVKCWGDNSYRQLGDLSTTTRTSPVTASLGLGGGVTVVKIAMATATSQIVKVYAFLSDGSVKVWGGGTTVAFNPTTLAGVSNAKDLIYDSPTGSACFISTSGALSCWGPNSSGQLGTGDLVTKTSPTTVSGISNIDTLRMANSSACALKTDGTVYCWGAHGLLDPQGIVVTNNILVPTLVPDLNLKNMTSGSNLYCGVPVNEDEIICWGAGLAGWKHPYYLTNNRSYQSLRLTTSSSILTNPSFCKDVNIAVYNNGTLKSLFQDLTVGLTDVAGFGAFYTDSSCTNGIQNITIPAGDSNRTVYYKGAHSSGYSKPFVISSSSNDIGIGKGSLGMTFTGPAYSVYVGDFYFSSYCSPHTVRIVDRDLNEAKLQTSLPVTFSFDVDSSIIETYSDSTCTTVSRSFTFAPGVSSITYYTKGQSCSSATITATSTLPQATTSQNYYEYCGGD